MKSRSLALKKASAQPSKAKKAKNKNRKSPRMGKGESLKIGKQRRKRSFEREKCLFKFLKLLKCIMKKKVTQECFPL